MRNSTLMLGVLVAASSCNSVKERCHAGENCDCHANRKCNVGLQCVNGKCASTKGNGLGGNMADERTTRSTAPDKVTDTETEVIQRLVSQWCEAHNAKNLDALSATYASSVFFYGRQQSSAACVASKKGLFAKNQEFTQTIVGGVQVQVQNLEARVAFMKRVVLSGTVTDYPSYLGLTKTSVGWRISVEGDDVTDANLQKAMGAAYRRAAGAGIESTDDVTASGSRWLTQYRLTAISGSKVSTRSRRTSRTRATSS